MKFILVTDVGSTTTKARLFKRTETGWRYVISGEAPTTVEAPYEDVTMGVCNAIREVEELTGLTILNHEHEGIIVPFNEGKGVDFYCTTSSAGGGLQMLCLGLIKEITAESANRAALGAGAIVMDIVALDDGRADYEKIKRIRSMRPDMVLMAGGADGGATGLVLELAELLKAADPTPRLGEGYSLPLVYAGNRDLRSHIKELFSDKFALTIVDNLRPVLEVENSEPARRAIHELFMEHVMSHAPGYTKLMKWTDVPIMPTPAGEGLAMQLIASRFQSNVLGVGLGGATTNVYSIVDGRFVRSVSANLGMSYSICNVLKEAGIDNIIRWLPFEVDKEDIENRLRNKMIRPTTIPDTLEDLLLEHAVAREALRLALEHHKTIATRLKGVAVAKTISERFERLGKELEETYIKMIDIGIIAGTGGLLSHAPRRVQSLLILTDAFQPEGVTRVFQDSVFMMPHLGVLSTVYPDIAWEIFDKDCLVRLGTVVAPIGSLEEGQDAMDITLEIPNGEVLQKEIRFGEIIKIPLPEGVEARAIIRTQRGLSIDMEGRRELETTVMGGVVGVILDLRGRPLRLPEDAEKRREKIKTWFKSLDLYPEEAYEEDKAHDHE
ncbi:glutamate mutase L [Candidatus Bathyarchaeota archaeon]|nr:glutamate mutase L [Candidatus Bathyarchaeota archaeon]